MGQKTKSLALGCLLFYIDLKKPAGGPLSSKLWIKLSLSLSLCLSARTWASWPQSRWVMITQGFTQSGWWSAFWSATRSQDTLTSKHDSDDIVLITRIWERLTKHVCCAGFRVAGGWAKVWMMGVWRGSWWESLWPLAQRMMKGCVGHPQCSSPRGWWGGLLPSRQTPNQVSFPST